MAVPSRHDRALKHTMLLHRKKTADANNESAEITPPSKEDAKNLVDLWQKLKRDKEKK
jgi:hypothetical protein